MKAQKITPITLRDALDMAARDRVLYGILFVLGLAELMTFLRRPLLSGAPLFLLLTNFYSLWLVSSAFGRG